METSQIQRNRFRSLIEQFSGFAKQFGVAMHSVAVATDMNLLGLQSNSVQGRKLCTALSRRSINATELRFGGNLRGYNDHLSRHLVFRQKLFSSAPIGDGLHSRAFAVKSRQDPNDPVGKSAFSFKILDIIAFLIRIPALILGLVKKEKQFIEKVEDQLDDAAETVGKVAQVIEDVAEVVENVAERIAEDAKDTREFMDKVEATADSMRSDIDTAVSSLEGALEPAKSKSQGSNPAPDIKAAGEAVSRAAEKAKEVKEAASELEQEAEGTVAEARSQQPQEKQQQSKSKFQVAAGSNRMFWGVLFASAAVLVINWWLPQLAYHRLLKYLLDNVGS